MKRRTFLRASGLGLASATIASKTLRADDESAELEALRGVRITSITGFRHECPRPKLVGKNSHLDVHGDRTVEHCLRIGTDRGIEGIGVGNLPPDRAGAIVGRSLDEFWRPGFGASWRVWSGRPRPLRPRRQGPWRAVLEADRRSRARSGAGLRRQHLLRRPAPGVPGARGRPHHRRDRGGPRSRPTRLQDQGRPRLQVDGTRPRLSTRR